MVSVCVYDLQPNERSLLVIMQVNAFTLSSIGHRHSRLSILGTSIFLKKIGVPTRGYFYSLSLQLRSPLCGSCCFIRVTSLSFNWVLVFVCNHKAFGRITKICGKCE